MNYFYQMIDVLTRGVKTLTKPLTVLWKPFIYHLSDYVTSCITWLWVLERQLAVKWNAISYIITSSTVCTKGPVTYSVTTNAVTRRRQSNNAIYWSDRQWCAVCGCVQLQIRRNFRICRLLMWIIFFQFSCGEFYS